MSESTHLPPIPHIPPITDRLGGGNQRQANILPGGKRPPNPSTEAGGDGVEEDGVGQDGGPPPSFMVTPIGGAGKASTIGAGKPGWGVQPVPSNAAEAEDATVGDGDGDVRPVLHCIHSHYGKEVGGTSTGNGGWCTSTPS